MGGNKEEEESEEMVIVIGGMVLDINAVPSVPAKPRTTTPGKVLYAAGGVGRNVAECLLKLGARPYMISVVGGDMAGNLLLEQWKSFNLPTEGIRRDQSINTAAVCNIFDGRGELASAVACVEVIENFLTPEWIEKFYFSICSSPVLMVDANLSSLALKAACQLSVKGNTPVWFEPVSVLKSTRVVPVAKYITFASPNEDELIAMANALSSANVFSPIKREDVGTKIGMDSLIQLLRPPILLLLERGIKVVIVTLGSDGAILCCNSKLAFSTLNLKKRKTNLFSKQLCDNLNSDCTPEWYVNVPKSEMNVFAVHFPALSAEVVRLTGAGDCLVGGMLASLSAGLNVIQSLAVGIATSKAAVESETNVPAEYCLSRITEDAKLVLSGATRFFWSPSKL